MTMSWSIMSPAPPESVRSERTEIFSGCFIWTFNVKDL